MKMIFQIWFEYQDGMTLRGKNVGEDQILKLKDQYQLAEYCMKCVRVDDNDDIESQERRSDRGAIWSFVSSECQVRNDNQIPTIEF